MAGGSRLDKFISHIGGFVLKMGHTVCLHPPFSMLNDSNRAKKFVPHNGTMTTRRSRVLSHFEEMSTCMAVVLAYFSLSLSCCYLVETSAVNQEIQPRIINGFATNPSRYPYMASLVKQDDHLCGGSLIAPDIVITAAHCSQSFGSVQLGRYDIGNSSEVYESFVVQEQITHPQYFRNRFLDVDPHDFLIVKLLGKSQLQPVQLNKNNSMPNLNDVLTVIGWGSTDPDNLDVSSDILLETYVDYIPNDACRQVVGTINGFEKRYEGEVVDATLCAINFETLADSCQGDSGGPLLIAGQSALEDVVVGITSAGFGCANPTLPALYARISEVYDWIVVTTCWLSEQPPDYFDCPNTLNDDLSGCDLPDNVDGNGSGTVLNTECPPGAPLVRLDIEFRLDMMPTQRGWVLKRVLDGSDIRVTQVERKIQSYSDLPPLTVVQESVLVPNNRAYEFILMDSYGDGNQPTTRDYSVRIRDENDNNLLLLSNLGDFGFWKKYAFTVGVLPTNMPTQSSAPSSSSIPTSMPTIERPYITLVISFDISPSNKGYLFEAMIDGKYELLRAVYPGTFQGDLALKRSTQTIDLLLPGPEPQNYRFTMTDNEGRGFSSGGGYGVWMGPPLAGNLLFDGGVFFFEDVNTFQVEPFFRLPPSVPPSTPIMPPAAEPTSVAEPYQAGVVGGSQSILDAFILLATSWSIIGLINLFF